MQAGKATAANAKAAVAKTKQQATVRMEFDRLAAAGRPWWAEAPDIAAKCLAMVVAPIRYAAIVAELAVSLSFLVVVGSALLWWYGYIPDAVVAEFLGNLGERLLSIIETSGLI